MIALALALLTPPPVPPPPPERVAAATELLRIAPVPATMQRQQLDGAISGVVDAAFVGSAADGMRMVAVRERLAARAAGDPRYAAAVEGCVIDAIGWTYELPTLQSIATIVTTPGGRALWEASLAGTVQQCHRDALFGFMATTGLASAVRWLAAARPAGSLPAYDPARDSAAQWADRLTGFCGKATRGALVERAARLGVTSAWADRGRNRAAFACLVQSARLAGYDLPEFLPDGSSATVIA